MRSILLEQQSIKEEKALKERELESLNYLKDKIAQN